MNRNTLSAALALAFAGMGGQAMALAPAAFNPANTNELYISGASAQENQLNNFMRRVCNVGTLDRYTATNQFAFFCTVNTATVPGLVKPNIVVYKSSVGGSGNGVQPVADASTLAFLDMATIQANTSLCSATSAVAAVTVAGDTLGLPAYVTRSCSSATQNKVTEAGFSDVEPALFGATTVQLNKLAGTTFSTNALTFGVPVTTNLRNALQTAQGLTSGSETEANMPSLTDTQIAAIYSGQIGTWDQFTSATGIPLNNAADNNIYIARRVDSSGTQTSARIYFLNNPCASGVLNFVAGNDTRACNTLTTGTLGTVFEGSGSGNVVSCLNKHHTDGRWALGVLSLEFNDSAGSGNNFRFIKLNGSSPTLFNVVNGRYRNWMETTTQWRNATAASPLGGDDLTFMNRLVTLIGEPPTIQAINTGFLHDWTAAGGAGLLALPSAFTPPAPYLTSAAVIDNPINTHTKAPLGAPVNCQPPVAAFPTVVGQ